MSESVLIPTEVLKAFCDEDNQKKSDRLEIRLTKNQRNALDFLADQYQIPTSELIRRKIFESDYFVSAITKREWELAGDYAKYRRSVLDMKSDFYRTQKSLGKIGSNVNQIARGVNRSGIVSQHSLQKIEEGLEEIRSELDSLQEKADRLLVNYETLVRDE